ncbi:MAG: MBL fold metallo-hydrolase [Phycisphaerae bacterium]
MSRLVRKTLKDITIEGFSLAGEETVVAAPELNVCFDVGRAPREIIPIDNICLSHGHMDHAAGVAYYLSQRSFIGNAPGRIIVDKSLAQPIQKLMDIWGDIEGHPSPGQIYGVEPLEDVSLRRDLVVRPFRVNHAAGALGFSLVETRHKLKPIYHGKSGPELVALKKDGIDIEDHVEHTLLTYSGDTALGRFLELPFVQASEALIVECTFFEPSHRRRAKAGRHLHIDDLPTVLSSVPHARVMLSHLSRRTDFRVAKRILNSVISEEDRQRVEFLMDRPARKRSDGESAGERKTDVQAVAGSKPASC